MLPEMTGNGKASLIAMAVSTSAGALAGYQGRRRNRTARTLAGAAYGAFTGGRMVAMGRRSESIGAMWKTAIANKGFQQQLGGSLVGAMGGMVTGTPLLGMVAGGIGGLGINHYQATGSFKRAGRRLAVNMQQGWRGMSDFGSRGKAAIGRWRGIAPAPAPAAAAAERAAAAVPADLMPALAFDPDEPVISAGFGMVVPSTGRSRARRSQVGSSSDRELRNLALRALSRNRGG